jgi:hypothetical protein
VRSTHTYVVMEVSQPVYDEVRHRMMEAGYQHALHSGDGAEVIDMHGIALRSLPAEPERGGVLHVGLTSDGREVVINHPLLEADKNGGGHIVFSPKQARHLAAALNKWAAKAKG